MTLVAILAAMTVVGRPIAAALALRVVLRRRPEASLLEAAEALRRIGPRAPNPPRWP
jgi:hypothetical protein